MLKAELNKLNRSGFSCTDVRAADLFYTNFPVVSGMRKKPLIHTLFIIFVSFRLSTVSRRNVHVVHSKV